MRTAASEIFGKLVEKVVSFVELDLSTNTSKNGNLRDIAEPTRLLRLYKHTVNCDKKYKKTAKARAANTHVSIEAHDDILYRAHTREELVNLPICSAKTYVSNINYTRVCCCGGLMLFLPEPANILLSKTSFKT